MKLKNEQPSIGRHVGLCGHLIRTAENWTAEENHSKAEQEHGSTIWHGDAKSNINGKHSENTSITDSELKTDKRQDKYLSVDQISSAYIKWIGLSLGGSVEPFDDTNFKYYLYKSFSLQAEFCTKFLTILPNSQLKEKEILEKQWVYTLLSPPLPKYDNGHLQIYRKILDNIS